jgi:hypothetical protein
LIAAGAHIRLKMAKEKFNNQANSMFLANNGKSKKGGASGE